MRVGSMSGLIALAVLATAAAPIPFVHHKPPRGGETITYHRPLPPLCLSCKAYTITLGPDGQGIVDSGGNLERGGRSPVEEHRFQASPEMTAAFTRRLRPYRPTGTVEIVPGKLCKEEITDQEQVDITWTAAESPPARLVYYEGCDAKKHRKMLAAIRSAPLLLPINSYIGLP